MRFQQLLLKAYGPFVDREINFQSSSRPGLAADFHVIYGPNEAGKSTAMRAIFNFFFGIPRRTDDAHRHSMSKLRIGATLEKRDGQCQSFLRRKGLRNTLMDLEETVLDPADLELYLGGTQSDVFRSLWTLNHSTLLQGGQELLRGQGALGEALFGASLGTKALHKKLSELKRRAEALFSPRSSKKPINLALKDCQSAKKQIREVSLPARQWLDLKQDKSRLEQQHARLKQNLSQHKAERSRLQRLLAMAPHRSRVQHLNKEIEAVALDFCIPESLSQDGREAEARLLETKPREQRLVDDIARLSSRREQLKSSQKFLSYEAVMESLGHRLGSQVKADKDMPRVWGEARLVEDDIEGLIRRLNWSEDLSSIDEARLDPATERRVQDLSLRKVSLDERLSQRTRQQQELTRRCAQQQRQLEQVKARQSSGQRIKDAEAAHKVLRANVSLDGTIAEAQAALRRLERELDQRFRALSAWPHWTGDFEALKGLALPPLSLLKERRGQWLDLKGRLQQQRAAHTQLQSESLAVKARVREWTELGALPSESDLQQARARRDQRLQEPPEAEQDWQALRDAVWACDELVDRLRREADRAAKQAQLMAREQELSARLALAKDRLEGLFTEKQRQLDQWRRLWPQCQTDDLEIGELLDWRAQVEEFQEQVKQQWIAKGSVEKLEFQRAECLNSSRHFEPAVATGSEKGQVPKAGGGIAKALNALERWLDEQNQVRQRATVLKEKIEDSERSLSELRDDHNQDIEALEQWQLEWREVMTALRLKDTTRAEEAAAVLECIRALFQKQDERVRLLRRYKGMKNDARRLEEHLSELCLELAPDLQSKLESRALVPVAEEILRRFRKAGEDERLRQDIDAQLLEKQEELSQVREWRRVADMQWQQCLEKAKCKSIDEFREKERLSDEVRRLETERRKAEAALLALGQGASLDELESELSAVDMTQVNEQLESLETTIQDLNQELSQSDQNIGQLREKVAAMDGESQAQDAAADLQGGLSRLRAAVDEYAQLRLAEALLRAQMERYRQQHQGPILERASALFRDLTLGSFQSLRTSFDRSDRPVLQVCREDGEALPVSALSEGSADQLYLAMRLACLEHRVKDSEPLPLICDDLFVNFDDDRAAAGFKILAEFSKSAQVIFFTHHKHLLDIARGALDESLFDCHELPPSRFEVTRSAVSHETFGSQ